MDSKISLENAFPIQKDTRVLWTDAEWVWVKTVHPSLLIEQAALYDVVLTPFKIQDGYTLLNIRQTPDSPWVMFRGELDRLLIKTLDDYPEES